MDVGSATGIVEEAPKEAVAIGALGGRNDELTNITSVDELVVDGRVMNVDEAGSPEDAASVTCGAAPRLPWDEKLIVKGGACAEPV